MRYKDINVVLQEIPNEITLCFTITGCNVRCDGCHSPYLWKEGTGEKLSDSFLTENLNRYKNTVSCVLFMGGEWNEDLLDKLKICKKHGFKTALYTGLTIEEISDDIVNELDYIKVGKWIKELGGLDKKETNQRLINLTNNEIMNHYFHK